MDNTLFVWIFAKDRNWIICCSFDSYDFFFTRASSIDAGVGIVFSRICLFVPAQLSTPNFVHVYTL